MPKVNVSRDHSLDPSALKERVATMEDKLREKYRAKTRWESDRVLAVEGPGVKGRLSIEDTRVVIDLDLGLMLGPMKGKIQDGLTRELEKVLSST